MAYTDSQCYDTDAFRQGRASCRAHYTKVGRGECEELPLPGNPHEVDTPAFYYWNRGWNSVGLDAIDKILQEAANVND